MRIFLPKHRFNQISLIAVLSLLVMPIASCKAEESVEQSSSLYEHCKDAISSGDVNSSACGRAISGFLDGYNYGIGGLRIADENAECDKKIEQALSLYKSKICVPESESIEQIANNYVDFIDEAKKRSATEEGVFDIPGDGLALFFNNQYSKCN